MSEEPVPEVRQRGRAASEKALLEAAMACFAECGPNDVSVRAIAECAGVNHGLVHHYFGSKAGLVDAVEDLLERTGVIFLRDRARSQSPQSGVTEAQKTAGSMVLVIQWADPSKFKICIPPRWGDTGAAPASGLDISPSKKTIFSTEG